MVDVKETSWMADFSPRQKKIVTYGITSLAICAIALLVTLVLILGGKIIRILSPAISPLVLGMLLSFVLSGFLEKISDKARGVVYWGFWLVVAFIVGMSLWIWGAQLVGQVDAFAVTIRNTYNSATARLPQFRGWVSEVKIAEYVAQGVTFFVSGLKNVSTWLFAVFFGYCFLRHPLNVESLVRRARELPFLSLSDRTWSFLQEQMTELVDMLTKYFPNQLLINICEGLVGAILMSFIGLPSGIVLGFLMGFMNIIPLVGTFIMLPIIIAVAYFCDGGSLLLVLYALCGWAVVEAIDLLVPPLVHGKEMKLHAGVTVFSFLFWGAIIDPVWGMILAIPLTAFSIGFVKAIKRFSERKSNDKPSNQSI